MYLIDIEASGLGNDSYPIEVAWLNTVTGDSDDFLISPDTGIETWSHWDPVAEAMHGIPRAQAVKKGVSVQAACRRLNSALGGQVAYSDNAREDLYWIRRLFDAAGLVNPRRCLFRIGNLFDLVGAEIVAELNALDRPHRALADCHAIAAIVIKCGGDYGGR